MLINEIPDRRPYSLHKYIYGYMLSLDKISDNFGS